MQWAECPDWCPVCGAELKALGWLVEHDHAYGVGPCRFCWDTDVMEMFPPVWVVLVDDGTPESRAHYERVRDQILRSSREGSE